MYIDNTALLLLTLRYRYEYFSRTQTFVHKIHSYAHETCATSFFLLVREKVQELCSSPEEREFAAQVIDAGSVTVQPDNPKCKGEHEQDAFIHHPFDPTYGLVLEVAYSQKRDALSQKAE